MTNSWREIPDVTEENFWFRKHFENSNKLVDYFNAKKWSSCLKILKSFVYYENGISFMIHWQENEHTQFKTSEREFLSSRIIYQLGLNVSFEEKCVLDSLILKCSPLPKKYHTFGQEGEELPSLLYERQNRKTITGNVYKKIK